MSVRRILSLLLFTSAVVAATWVFRVRRRPRACPFGQRAWLDMPRPFMRRTSLLEVLQPRPGERILEIGPGTGYYTLAVAPWLAPGGQLDALDLQQAMLIELRHRRLARGIDNVVETPGDASELPYADATFDAAYLVATLGEVAGSVKVLGEIRRVLKPSGRLVVGEGQPDPHMVSEPRLQEEASAVGFTHERTSGFRLGYFARFRASN